MSKFSSQEILILILLSMGGGWYLNSELADHKDHTTNEPTDDEKYQLGAEMAKKWATYCSSRYTFDAAIKRITQNAKGCVLAIGHTPLNCRDYNVVNNEVSCIFDFKKASSVMPRYGCTTAIYNLATNEFRLVNPKAIYNDSPENVNERESLKNDYIPQNCSPENVSPFLYTSLNNMRVSNRLFYDTNMFFPKRAFYLYGDDKGYEQVWISGMFDRLSDEQWDLRKTNISERIPTD